MTAVGNWTTEIQDAVKGKSQVKYIIGTGGTDPSVGCAKDFTATYRCGTLPEVKTISIKGTSGAGTGTGTAGTSGAGTSGAGTAGTGTAAAQSAIFDCSRENNNCKGFRLTLGDDGNLVLTDKDKAQIWSSNTSKTGLLMEQFNAKNSKYGRNYLLPGEVLNLGEFMGSPSGNCYLIMNKSADGNGFQLNYSVSNCDGKNIGNDDNTNGLFSIAQTAYNALMGDKQKIKPNMASLNKELADQKDIFTQHTAKMKKYSHKTAGTNANAPTLTEQIQQLAAMNEDAGLFKTRYKYRKIAWLTLAVLILIGAIKMARNNS
jgi:hypothetical protein